LFNQPLCSGQESVLRLFDQWAGTQVVALHWKLIARMCTAARGGDAEGIIQLAKQDVPVDSKDIRGATPLWHAASENHTDTVRALLGTNAVDVNAADIDGRTPLFWPSAFGDVEIVKLLLDHGAQKDHMDNDGKSPYMMAQSYRQARVLDLLAGNNN
jgi:ankyrin repeat protein